MTHPLLVGAVVGTTFVALCVAAQVIAGRWIYGSALLSFIVAALQAGTAIRLAQGRSVSRLWGTNAPQSGANAIGSALMGSSAITTSPGFGWPLAVAAMSSFLIAALAFRQPDRFRQPDGSDSQTVPLDTWEEA